MAYQLLTDELIDRIDTSAPEFQGDWLFLKETSEFPGFWQVEGVDDEFFYDFEDILGAYRLVSPARLDSFLAEAEKRRYQVAFVQEPERILDGFQALNEDPPVSLSSTLEKTRNGMLPWQIIGFNKLIKSDLPAGLAIWDTGSGKSALCAAAMKYYLDQDAIDLGLVVVKAHNKIDTQRKLKSLAGIDAVVIDGYKPLKRFERYEEVEQRLEEGPLVVVTNYETFRNDPGIMDHLVANRRCFYCWDEMPTKLGNRDTQLYKAVKGCLYKSFASSPRTSWAHHLMLSATPIENDPGGLYDCINLMRPHYLGNITTFEAEHVTRRDPWKFKPTAWTGLDKIEARIEHMTHRVSKADPEVAMMFPAMMPPDPNKIIDWNPKHRVIYDRFTKACEDLLKEESGVNALSMIQVLQMLCDAPSMVLHSANNRAEFLRALELDSGTDPWGSEAALRLLDMVPLSDIDDAGHTKILEWKDIITVKHPKSKIVTHSTWASYIFPVWESHLDEWGISYVTYTGTDKQKQEALDAFRYDPSIRLFLSGDAGADSIDIPQADTGVSFNGAWKATTMLQRKGRINRVDSDFKINYYYNLMMANSVEDRKREIRERKQGYHDAIFEGRALESALTARMDQSDLFYIIRGDADE
jgi:SNF2 family DNA or RNA helicase